MQRLWSLGGRLVVVLPCPMTRDVRRPGTFQLLREIRICCTRLIKCLCLGILLTTAQKESAVGLGSMFCQFHCLGHYWNLRISGLPLSFEWHGLSCKYSAGRFPRHSAIHGVIKRALQKTGLPWVLEPPGLDIGDESRPDGTVCAQILSAGRERF